MIDTFEVPIETTTLPLHAAAFRQFNRMYTRLIGTLDEGYQHTAYSLAEGRVLFEISTRKNPSAKDIGEWLGLDPGYLSRILQKFLKAGLVKRTVSSKDSRFAELNLTPLGRSAFRKLNALSEKQARAILASLPSADQTQLIESMKAIEGILTPDKPLSAFVIRSHRSGDMGWVVESEGRAYTDEYGWDSTFEALVARIVADFLENFDPTREHCWIAESAGQRIGHIFLVKHPEEPAVAKLRLLFVDKSARGKGLGQVLVNECVRFARKAGYSKITLWTQSILAAAHRLYVHAGFKIVREESHHSFGKDLVGQTWELDLAGSEKT